MGHYSDLEQAKQDKVMEKFRDLQEDKHQYTEHDNDEWHKEWEDFVEMTNKIPKEDLVNHPSHYCNHPSGIECIQITEHMNFCLGNCQKYIWRAGLKEGSNALQDLKKAQFYLNREIERLEK